MKKILAALLLCSTSLNLSAAERKSIADNGREVVSKLWADRVPEIPEKIKKRMRQYQNTRSSRFQDWLPGGGMFISTRFAERWDYAQASLSWKVWRR